MGVTEIPLQGLLEAESFEPAAELAGINRLIVLVHGRLQFLTVNRLFRLPGPILKPGVGQLSDKLGNSVL